MDAATCRANLERWMNDLLTTSDPQTRGVLTRVSSGKEEDETVGDCCLGRLCQVLGITGHSKILSDLDYGILKRYGGNTSLPPKMALAAIGSGPEIQLKTPDGEWRYAIQLNDELRWTFKQIGEAVRCTLDATPEERMAHGWTW